MWFTRPHLEKSWLAAWLPGCLAAWLHGCMAAWQCKAAGPQASLATLKPGSPPPHPPARQRT